jgi:endo-1,4-beta-xylanase
VETRRAFAKEIALAGAGALLAPRFLRGQGVTSSTEAGSTGGGTLKAHAAARGLYVGAAVNVGLLDRDIGYARTVAEQYNIVVAENAMKWAALRPAPDRFDFAEADRLMAFAAMHGMAVRGHTLCWHEALPAWFAGTVNRRNAEAYLVRHVETVVGRYKGRIRAWDVVNEAVELKDGRPDGLRKSAWLELLGPRYLEIAFRAARAADPAALLTYNEYGIETDGAGDTAKREAVLALLGRLKRERVPIDAVGVQSHLSADSAAEIGSGLSGFAVKARLMGLKVSITELDVNDDSLMVDDPATRGKAVAGVYGGYVGSLLRNPAVTDVLCWGVSDRYSWLNGRDAVKFRPKHPGREEVCLPFDNNYGPHPAFYALRAALDSRAGGDAGTIVLQP